MKILHAAKAERCRKLWSGFVRNARKDCQINEFLNQKLLEE